MSAESGVLQIPEDVADAAQRRIDEMIQPIADLLQCPADAELRRKIKHIFMRNYADRVDYERSATRAAVRRALARTDAAVGELSSALLELAEVGQRRCTVYVEAMDALISLKKELDDQESALGKSGRGDHARVDWPPAAAMVTRAELLYLETARRIPSGSEIADLASLLWEVATGESDRSFAKATRSRGRRRTRDTVN